MKKLGKKMWDLLRLWAEAFLVPLIMMMLLIDGSRHAGGTERGDGE